jgi:UDP-2,3-diacylglucosamine pyrophosphatase LpxH
MAISASSLPAFDELHVVSDLHLGGPAGFQIFNLGASFGRLVDHLRMRAGSDRRVGLLINGDLVDFLAERPFLHFDPDGAIDKLDRIVADGAFAPVWAALKQFAAASNCHLIVNLGNHDLELALPWVRARLLEILANGSPQARGQVTISIDGAGIRCRIGGAQVLAVHGNEVDDWNLADYETIRRIGRDITEGIPVQPWVPNAGSRLVVEVMNDIKGRFPFVDLLKPEIDGVVPTILALAPDQRDKIAAIRRTVGRLLLDWARRRVGLLGADEEETTATMAAGAVGGEIRPLRRVVRESSTSLATAEYAASLLDETEERFGRNTSPLSLIQADAQSDYLGAKGALVNVFRRAGTSEVLREALERLGNDRSFDLRNEDDQFKKLDAQVGDVDFLLAGHTHLERMIPRQRGRGIYFNTGTWVRLIRLDKNVLADPNAFAQIVTAFKAGSMKALDDQPGLIERRPAVATVWMEQGKVCAELRRSCIDANDPVLTPVPGTRIDG